MDSKQTIRKWHDEILNHDRETEAMILQAIEVLEEDEEWH